MRHLGATAIDFYIKVIQQASAELLKRHMADVHRIALACLVQEFYVIHYEPGRHSGLLLTTGQKVQLMDQSCQLFHKPFDLKHPVGKYLNSYCTFCNCESIQAAWVMHFFYLNLIL